MGIIFIYLENIKVKRDNGGKKGKWRNMNKEPMDKDNRGED